MLTVLFHMRVMTYCAKDELNYEIWYVIKIEGGVFMKIKTCCVLAVLICMVSVSIPKYASRTNQAECIEHEQGMVLSFAYAEETVDPITIEESYSLTEFAANLLDGQEYSEFNLYEALLRITFDCNDFDLYNALKKWSVNSSVQLTGYNIQSDSSQVSEEYYYRVHVEDSVVNNDYIVGFNCWVNLEYEEGEYYTCNIETISTGNKLKNIVWTSREAPGMYFVADYRPDGQTAIEEYMYDNYSVSGGWDSKYSILTLLPIDEDRGLYPYAYEIDYGGYVVNCMLYPDETIYFPLSGITFYIEGTEENAKATLLSTGNIVGNTSSNKFNGGVCAVEDQYMVYTAKGNVYRVSLDGSNEMCLRSGSAYDYVGDINIINGEVYFIYEGSKAYGYDINGNCLFEADGYILGIAADEHYVFYTISKDRNSGVFRYEKESGITDQIASLDARNISIDGDWVYFDDLNQNKIYRVRKDGGSTEIVYENDKIGGFIAQDGYVLFYVYDNDVALYMRQVYSDDSLSPIILIAHYSKFGGISAYSGSEKTKKISEKDGWLYYYYARDNSMICRMALDGSVDDEFVCYTEGRNRGIYIFDDLLYLQGEGTLTFAGEIHN